MDPHTYAQLPPLARPIQWRQDHLLKNGFGVVGHQCGGRKELWPNSHTLHKKLTQNEYRLYVNHKTKNIWEKKKKLGDLGPGKEF